MKIVETIAEYRKLRAELPEPVGFFPTLGFLHEGHLSLVRRAHEENESVVVSIFVNPTQFGPTEDLDKYPRDYERDLAMLEPYTDVVFMPSPAEMYPPNYDTWVDVETVTGVLEGASRPGHFRGVATVCAKLFSIVQPARAYFAQKDAQQLLVIKKMVKELNMPLEIVTCPTVREPDGLAMSSRNTFLTTEQRRASVILNKSLVMAGEMWQIGEHDAGTIRKAVTDLIKTEPLAEIDYISVANTETLRELEGEHASALVSMAVRFGNTRLIDNITLE
ncbi:MAG: pantoate--beta-alanine ligase [Dehalococcoidales bacterium]|nr:pantoate--beta-alanine ligase [Dehalococcoidales bacterium]